VISVSTEERGDRWFELSSHPAIGPDGDVRTVVEHARDVTEMVREKQATQRVLANKATLLREVHHRMKNNMSIVVSLLALKSHQVDDPDCRAALQDARNRLGSVQALYDRLQSSEEYTVVEMKGYLGDVIRELSEMYRDLGVTLHPAIGQVELPAESAVCVGIVVNELVTNAAKYAYPDGGGGDVHIRLRAAEDDQAELVISDDGVGLPQHAAEGRLPGFGLAMARGLVRQLSGTFDVETSPRAGTRFLIRFPRDQ
jgi:two-component sensor histidine kinase